MTSEGNKQLHFDDMSRLFNRYINHDLKTHFYNIKGILQMFSPTFAPDPAIIQKVILGCNTSNLHLNTYLLFMKIIDETEPLHQERIHLDAILQNALSAIDWNPETTRIQSNIPGLITIISDPEKLSAGLQLLLIQMLDHTQQGQPVIISGAANQTETYLTIKFIDNSERNFSKELETIMILGDHSQVPKLSNYYLAMLFNYLIAEKTNISMRMKKHDDQWTELTFCWKGFDV